jgi:hypothetical protein
VAAIQFLAPSHPMVVAAVAVLKLLLTVQMVVLVVVVHLLQELLAEQEVLEILHPQVHLKEVMAGLVLLLLQIMVVAAAVGHLLLV